MPVVAALTIAVHDMEAALDFYTDHLGFAVHSGGAGDEIVQLDTTSPVVVLQRAAKPTAVDYPDQACTMLNLAVDDIDETTDRLRSAGVAILTGGPVDGPPGRFIAVNDPSGNVVELIQFS